MTPMETRLLKAFRALKKTPVTAKELAKKIGLRKSSQEVFRQTLESLKEQNKIMERNGRFVLAENLGLTPGKIVKVAGSFGFARPDGSDRDVFIPGRMLAGSLPGDSVLLRITRGSGELPEGEVFKVTAEVNPRFSAVLELLPDGSAQVHPDRWLKYPLAVHSARLMGAKSGDKVLCEIASRGQRHSEHRARIVETFGSSQSAAACCRSILAANDIPAEFPPEVKEQALAITAGQGIHPGELASRLDLRGKLIFTIDGADSKDLDDAVSLRRLPDGGWDLGVHIADVSYYVTHGTPIDQEAFQRGTSTYYADSVVPMLPEELSNGICSLNPGEDRLAFSALMRLGPDGAMKDYQFRKTVIRSRVKGIYREINSLYDQTAGPELLQKYEELIPTLEEMRTLAALLTRRRFARGGMDLESEESKIILDQQGVAVDVQPRERGVSEMLIEEFMLCANEAAATFALEKGLPFVYRIHELPAPDKVGQLFDVLEQLGVKAKRPSGAVTSARFAEILSSVRGTPSARIVNTMVLRSMAKARYSEANVGHFGLALKKYTHFTSPIRRYPDLTIHRILSGFVTGMRRDNIDKRFGGFAAQSAARSSEREIASMTAERGCEDCYKAEYMRAHLGEIFDGVISSVTPYGIYIQLPSTVEGLVNVRAFPEGQWQADGVLAFVEKHTGRRMRLGDPVRVRAAAADVSAGTIDFVFAPEE